MGDQKSEWQAEELIGNHTVQRDRSGAWRSSWGKEVAGGTWRMQLGQGKDPALNLNLKIAGHRWGGKRRAAKQRV